MYGLQCTTGPNLHGEGAISHPAITLCAWEVIYTQICPGLGWYTYQGTGWRYWQHPASHCPHTAVFFSQSNIVLGSCWKILWIPENSPKCLLSAHSIIRVLLKDIEFLKFHLNVYCPHKKYLHCVINAALKTPCVSYLRYHHQNTICLHEYSSELSTWWRWGDSEQSASTLNI